MSGNIQQGTGSHKFPGMIRIPPSNPNQGRSFPLAPGTGRGGLEPSQPPQPPGRDGRATPDRRIEPDYAIMGNPEIVFKVEGREVCMSDVARETGLTLGAVSRIFNGLRKARKATLKSIANLYCEGRIEDVVASIRHRVLRQMRLKERYTSDEDRETKIRILKAYEETNYRTYGA